MTSDVQSAIIAAAQAAGVDPNLAVAVAQQESGGNQNAVSSAGAIGIFQLMPATATELGVDPTDAMQNIQGGIAYLSQLLTEFGGNVTEVLGAYNWGPAAVTNAIASYSGQWLNHAPSETQNYVAAIIGKLGIATITATNAVSEAASTAIVNTKSFLEEIPTWALAAGVGGLVLILVLLAD